MRETKALPTVGSDFREPFDRAPPNFELAQRILVDHRLIAPSNPDNAIRMSSKPTSPFAVYLEAIQQDGELTLFPGKHGHLLELRRKELESCCRTAKLIMATI